MKQLILVFAMVGTLVTISGCTSTKAHVVAVRNPYDALDPLDVSLRAWGQTRTGVIIQDHLVGKFSQYNRGADWQTYLRLLRAQHDLTLDLYLRAKGEIDLPVTRGEKLALANLAVASAEHNRVWAEIYAGPVEWEAFLARVSVGKPQEWQRENLQVLFGKEASQFDVVKEALIRCQMLHTILQLQAGKISDPAMQRYFHYHEEAAYARAYLVYAHYQRMLQGQPVYSDLLRSIHAIGQWSKAYLTFRMAEAFPRVRAAILTLSTEDAQKFRGEGRDDADGFATFREWMAGAPEVRQEWLSQNFQHQILIWHLVCEIPLGAYQGHGSNVVEVKASAADWRAVGRAAEKLPRPVAPPRRMEVGDRVKITKAPEVSPLNG